MAQRANQKSQAKQNSPTDHNPPKLTFLEHFRELRKRIFWVVLMLVLMTVVGLELKDWLIEIVVAPLRGQQLIYLTPGGGFNFIFTLSLYFAALFTIPIGVLQLFRFLQPLLPRVSRKFIATLVAVSTLLAGAGAALAYFLAIPAALGFLDGFTGNSIVPSLTAESYLNFVVVYVVGLAMLFQLPLLLFLYDHIRPIPPGALARSQRYGIVIATILAALVTPSPDLTSYAIVLVPILGVYELGVLTVYLRRKLLRGRSRRQQPAPRPAVVASNPVPTSTPAPVPVLTPATRLATQPVVMKPAAQPLTAVMTSQPRAVTPARARTARSVRSIDGMRVSRPAPAPAAAPVVQQPKVIRKSIDGVLTVSTQA